MSYGRRGYLRAKPQGIATRTKTVGKPRGIKPLPLNLQVLPQTLVRTPVNPGCTTTREHWGKAAEMLREWSVDSFLRGRDLAGSGAYELHVDGNVFFHDDGLYALAWCRVARLRGVEVVMIRN